MYRADLDPAQQAALPGWGLWVFKWIACAHQGDAWAAFDVWLNELDRRDPSIKMEFCVVELSDWYAESSVLDSWVVGVICRILNCSRSLRNALTGSRHD